MIWIIRYVYKHTIFFTNLLGQNQGEESPNGVTEHYDDYVYGDEDSDISEYTVVYDDGVDVNSSVEL